MALRTFTPLSELPRTPVQMCAQMLPNQCQCWKPGYIQVTEAVDGGEATQYQLCRGHATLLKQQDDAEKLAAGEQPPVPISSPDQLKKNDLEKEAVKVQTTPPKGEDSPNNVKK